MRIWKLLGGVMAAVITTGAMATSVDEDAPFAALQWTFGDKGLVPDVVVGYRSVEVETDGDVSGWQGSLSYKPHHGVDKVKLEAVSGDNELQYTYGGGYSLKRHKAFLTAGVNGSHLVGGLDYFFGGHSIEPYFGLTTLGDYDVPQAAVAAPVTTTTNDGAAGGTSPADGGTTSTTDTPGGDLSIAGNGGGTTTTTVSTTVAQDTFSEFKDCDC